MLSLLSNDTAYLDRSRGLTNLLLDLSFVHKRHGASRASPQDNGKLTFNDLKRMDQPLEDRAQTKTLQYTKTMRTIRAPSSHQQANPLSLEVWHSESP